ncbi:ethanolamine kinase 1 isoform X2 [Bombina bombina]|uniref:ethanolamine kinase 1 isoform X2 n=1 Tax=Bombina bombina TaxID=8345 RepID=UPI00235B140C|nr:ethanolamine kinase 1 isoform X2 [Bombina bombina]
MANYIHVPPGSPDVPKLDLTVLETGYREGAMRLLQEIRPEWKAEEVTTKVFTDGITNKLIGCHVGDEMKDVVLVRIYGNKTELLVDRDEELKSFRVLQSHGCAPQLYCTFNNGLCYKFMQGEALDPEHVCNPTIFRLIARQLAKIHAIHAHNGWIPKSNMWLKMRKYFSLIPTEFEDEKVNNRFLQDVPNSQVLEAEMTWMKDVLSNLGSPVVLSHNDLLCKNIIYNEKQEPILAFQQYTEHISKKQIRFAFVAALWRRARCLLNALTGGFIASHVHMRLPHRRAHTLVMCSSLTMNTLDTTTRPMILGIILMNLQVLMK